MFYCPTAFPQKYVATLMGITSQISNDTTVGIDSYIYPITGKVYSGTNQLQGWDQLASIYQRFRPISMAVEIRACILPQNNNLAGNVLVRTIWKDNGTVWRTNIGVGSDAFVKNTAICVNDGFKTIRSYCKAWTPHGMTRQQWMNDPSTAGTTEGYGQNVAYQDPGRMAYFHVYVNDQALSSSIYYNMEIKFKVTYEFYDRVPLIDG